MPAACWTKLHTSSRHLLMCLRLAGGWVVVERHVRGIRKFEQQVGGNMDGRQSCMSKWRFSLSAKIMHIQHSCRGNIECRIDIFRIILLFLVLYYSEVAEKLTIYFNDE